MKRLILGIALLVMMFSLVACGDDLYNGKKDSDKETTQTSTSTNNEVEKEVEVKIDDGRDSNRYSEVENNPVVTIEMEDGKTIKVELYPKLAPMTVENFISLVNSNFYDGVIFHRVIPGFMAQGGDPLGKGIGGPGYRIKGEFKGNGFEQNTLKHDIGVISMARAQDPNSAGSQFFIVTGEEAYKSLDEKYAGFGKVIEGMDAVYEIVNSPVKYSSNDLNAIYEKVLSGVSPENLSGDEIELLQAYQSGEQFDLPINPPKIKTMTVETFGVEYAEPYKIAE